MFLLLIGSNSLYLFWIFHTPENDSFSGFFGYRCYVVDTKRNQYTPNLQNKKIKKLEKLLVESFFENAVVAR